MRDKKWPDVLPQISDTLENKTCKNEEHSPRVSPTAQIEVRVRITSTTVSIGIVGTVDTRVACGN
jgi:hypothetical protein